MRCPVLHSVKVSEWISVALRLLEIVSRSLGLVGFNIDVVLNSWTGDPGGAEWAEVFNARVSAPAPPVLSPNRPSLPLPTRHTESKLLW